ncbi:DoxX family protein [Dermacoccaceae bacterium W4C1]
MQTFLKPPALIADIALLVCRLLLGVILIAHGWQKFFDNGIDATGAGFAQMGVPAADASATFTATVELVGGALLVLGLFTPVVGVLVALTMAGAFWFAHRDAGVFATDGGWELVAALGVAALAIGAVGAGRFSMDEVLRSRAGAQRAVPA